jgi:hypothetical protein
VADFLTRYLTPPSLANYKRTVKILAQFLSVLVLVAVLFPADAAAQTRKLWGGLVTFNVPKKSTVEKVEPFDLRNGNAYAVEPRQRSRKVAVLIVREKLGPRLTALSNEKLAGELKKRFGQEGVKLDRFRAKGKTLTGRISGKGAVPWSEGNARVKGEFRMVRVAPSLVVMATVFSPPGDFGKSSVKPFRKLVSSFKVRKPKGSR